MIWLDGIAALATGVLSGWGIGGGSLLMVYLKELRHLPHNEAALLNLLYFVPTAGSSLWGHIKNKKIIPPVVWPALAAGLLTGGGCAWLAQSFAEGLIKKAFGVLLCYIGVMELFRKTQ
jgi:hypothetical protein